MKKLFILAIAVLLLLSLAACGGGDSGGSNNSGGNDNPLNRQGDSGNGNDDPLNRADNSGTSMTSPSGDDTDPGAMGVDEGAFMGGDIIVSGLDEEAKQAFIEEARADGYDVTFGADGSMRMEDIETGEIVIQNPDGSWTISDGEDGGEANFTFGGEWPDNELTRLVPKPEFTLAGAMETPNLFGVTFVNATIEEIRDYTEQIKTAGFTVGAATEDQEFMGMVIFSYEAKNADGYSINVFSASGVAGMSIEKP